MFNLNDSSALKTPKHIWLLKNKDQFQKCIIRGLNYCTWDLIVSSYIVVLTLSSPLLPPSSYHTVRGCWT